MVVRNNQLGFARRGALAKMAGQNVGAFTTVRHGTVDGPDGVARLMVSFEGETPVSVASLSGKYPVGGVVAVLVDSAGRPQHVLGAVESGLTDSETGEELTPEFVQVLPDLVPPGEISAEEKARLEGVEAGLAEAQAELAAAGENLDAAIAERLFVEKIITGSMLADGAVTARTLNVVPEEGTGGLKLDAYGMDVVGPDTGEAATFVSFRADQANAISFVQDGASTFSVSPAGDVVAQSVAANASLTYRGVELEGLLGQLPQGVVSDQVAYMNTFMQLDSVERTALLSTVPARDPALGDRQYKIHVQISSNYSGENIGVRVRYTEDGTQVKTTSPELERTFFKDNTGIYTFDLFHSAPADKELHYRLGLWSSAGVRLPSAGIATHMWVEDLGPAVPVRSFTPSQGSGGGQTPTPDPTTETSTYVREFSPTWTRSYWGDGSFYNREAGRAYHGQYLAVTGILGSAVGFNRTEISAFIGTGEVTKVEVYLQNAHTYSSAGMTAQFGTHSYTSAPSSFNVPAGSQSTTFKKGQGKWVTLPSSMWTAWKTGSANGVTLKPSTSSQMSYGYFDGTKTRVRITVRK